MDKLIRNRRGDIPITILVIGVVALCILTIFSFMYSDNKKKESFVGPGLIETAYAIQEELRFGKGENLNPFEKDGVKIIFAEGKINAEYISEKGILNKEQKTLILIEYLPIK